MTIFFSKRFVTSALQASVEVLQKVVKIVFYNLPLLGGDKVDGLGEILLLVNPA